MPVENASGFRRRMPKTQLYQDYRGALPCGGVIMVQKGLGYIGLAASTLLILSVAAFSRGF
ncbi:MAG: hypothetical protein LCH39_00130 [Proteobacteria bacterium]|nr:hypothetical protein [Pseudomonadota bacterium]